MSNEDTIKSAITNFIMKLCSIERYIEIKRQMLCDKNDFEPYVAYQRLVRRGHDGISSGSILQYLSENLIDLRLDQVRQVLSHYDSDSDGILSYKEFLEVVLPKEHPELRAYVTQRECFDIKNEEYLSYETEAAMAVLFNLETVLFEDSRGYRDELHKLGISGYEIVGILDGNPQGSLNFDNIQRYLNQSGLMPYDSEIISFLRRIDRDDDGVITGEEMHKFLERYKPQVELDQIPNSEWNVVSRARLECMSPGRKIVQSQYKMIPVVEGVTTSISNGHRFIPATDTLIEKTIVQGRQSAEVGNINRNMNHAKISHRTPTQIQNGSETANNQNQIVNVNRYEDIVTPRESSRQILPAQNSSNQLVKNHPEFVQSLVSKESFKQGVRHFENEGILLERKDNTNANIDQKGSNKAYETFGRRLVTPNGKQERFGEVTVNMMGRPQTSTSQTPLEGLLSRKQSNHNSVAGFRDKQHVQITNDVENFDQNKENMHINQNTDRNRGIDFQRKLIFKEEARVRDNSLNREYNMGSRAHSRNLEQVGRKVEEVQEQMISSRSQLALQRSIERKSFALKAKQAQDQNIEVQMNQISHLNTPKVNVGFANRKGLEKVFEPQTTLDYTPVVQKSHKDINSTMFSTYQTAEVTRKNESLQNTQRHETGRSTNRLHENVQELTPDNQEGGFRGRLEKTKTDGNLMALTPDYTRQFVSSSSPVNNNSNTIANKNGNMNSRGRINPSINNLENKMGSKRTLGSNRAEGTKSPRSRSNHRRKMKNDQKRGGSKRQIQATQAHIGIKIFADTLIDMVVFEKEVEESKRAICGQADFCGEVLVSLVDQNGVGYVEYASFYNFVKDLNSISKHSDIGASPIKEEEIKLLFEEIRDYTRQDSMDLNFNYAGYDSLVGLICPRDMYLEQQLAREMQEKEFRDFQRNGISEATQKALSQCFQMIFQQRRMLCTAKVEFKRQQLEFHDVFESIDLQRKGYLTSDDFKVYIQSHNTEFRQSSAQEVEIFADSCDLDRDGKVTFKDFYMFFTM